MTKPYTEESMSNSIKTQILEAEEKLRLAMLHSDVDTLNKLLAPELVFTNHGILQK
ncbi:hypothetical protein H1P_60052 [Hyella patelloides LEGE 07179]|uniref:DUF4440 domain-containing protein n=1 Tax=Hyella patelloides LEGE 07179 TaxID=945734 RepID=A0A563W159_9CYAN|nr:hypothetical protein H1P_60052 [Hyella patelloides LEGE 07179]